MSLLGELELAWSLDPGRLCWFGEMSCPSLSERSVFLGQEALLCVDLDDLSGLAGSIGSRSSGVCLISVVFSSVVGFWSRFALCWASWFWGGLSASVLGWLKLVVLIWWKFV